MKLLARLFRREEINGDGKCPTYLYRWTLLRIGKWGAVYLHKFVGEDWARDLHDHPKRFVSIGLKGSYVEVQQRFDHPFTPEWYGEPSEAACGARRDPRDPGCGWRGPECGRMPFEHFTGRAYRAPWIRTFAAEHAHRLTGPTPWRPCWTLVIVGPKVREWGFWHRNTWLRWDRYVHGAEGEAGKACV